MELWTFSLLQQDENICTQVSPIQGELGKGPVGRFGKAAWEWGPEGQEIYSTWSPGKGFPGGSDGKESICDAGDPGSTPASGRSLGEGNGNPLQYSCLENPMNRGAWWAIVHEVAESDTTETLSMQITESRKGFRERNQANRALGWRRFWQIWRKATPGQRDR